MSLLAPILIAVFPLLVIVAALKDVTSFIIPNWISIGLVLAFSPAAKLLAGCALWMGWPTVLPFLLATALAGGALALILMQMRSNLLKPYLQRGPAWMERLVTAPDSPYGLAIAVGALVMLPQSLLLRTIGG